MKVITYNPSYFETCLKIIQSNTPEFFGVNEVPEYKEFLESLSHVSEEPYYLILENEKVIGCGGIFFKNGYGGLSWGMVENKHRLKGYGSQFLDYRLKKINELYGDVPVRIETSQISMAFFKKFGFKTQKIIPNGFAKGIDLVEMVRGRD